jgi:hypothetical protein
MGSTYFRSPAGGMVVADVCLMVELLIIPGDALAKVALAVTAFAEVTLSTGGNIGNEGEETEEISDAEVADTPVVDNICAGSFEALFDSGLGVVAGPSSFGVLAVAICGDGVFVGVPREDLALISVSYGSGPV